MVFNNIYMCVYIFLSVFLCSLLTVEAFQPTLFQFTFHHCPGGNLPGMLCCLIFQYLANILYTRLFITVGMLNQYSKMLM